MNDISIIEYFGMMLVSMTIGMYAIKSINYYRETKEKEEIKASNICTDNFCSFGRSFRTNKTYLLLPFPLDYAYVAAKYKKLF